MALAHNSPFHDGEIEIQRLKGVVDDIGPWASKDLRAYMPQ